MKQVIKLKMKLKCLSEARNDLMIETIIKQITSSLLRAPREDILCGILLNV